MERNDILQLFDNCIFNKELSSDSFEEYILKFLPSDFYYDYYYGVSKLTLVPIGERFVIKIPFNGSLGEAWNEHDGDWSDTTFYNFEFANSDKKRSWDYCLSEVLAYREAKKCGVNKCFAKTSFVGTVRNHPIYIQERAVPFADTIRDWNKYSKEKLSSTEERCSEYEDHFGGCGLNYNNVIWLTDAYDYYGEDRFNRILDFIDNYGINDLHDENIGYIGYRPVIFDFSSWQD